MAQQKDPVLLGVVTAPSSGTDGLEILRVLPRSPAQQAGVKSGDQLLAVDGHQLEAPTDIDKALQGKAVGATVSLQFVRDGAEEEVSATLVSQAQSRGTVLRGRDSGVTGFRAPAWYAYAWANVTEGQEPPSLANTQGKVVVIHCFQSW
jgi:predicted metalloprotease with PDZ domain